MSEQAPAPPAAPTRPTPPLRAASLGSLPGTDMPAALRLVMDETEVLSVPELPARGVGADMIGRAGAMLAGLGVDLQPAGWRLTDASGADQRRARALLRRDLDDLEEVAHDHVGVAKLAVTGPWTLAACLERPRGDRVLADHGARRDVAASLAEGVAALLAELRRRLPGLDWWLQLDEPLLGTVLAGGVPTASGFGKHRAVDAPGAAQALDLFAPLAETVALHWCGPGDLELQRRTGLRTASLDLDAITGERVDQVAEWLESGRRVWWGTMPTHQPDRLTGADAAADRLVRLVTRLGVEPALALDGLLTPACGLATWSAGAASAALRQAVSAAEIAQERLSTEG